MKQALAALMFLATALPVAADGYSIHAGGADQGVRRLTANYLPGAVVLKEFGGSPAAGGRGRYAITVNPEFGVSGWRGPNGHSLQLSAVPMFRLEMPSRWFVEAGVGISYFTSTGFATKDITSHFHFADHLGVGWHFAERQSLGVRVSHFSNLGLKRPNPGIDALQVSYTHRF